MRTLAVGAVLLGCGLLFTFGTDATAGKKETGNAVGGTYAFGPVKLGLVYERFKKDDRTDQKPWMANIVYTLGNNQFSYQYETLDGGLASGVSVSAAISVVGSSSNSSSCSSSLMGSPRAKAGPRRPPRRRPDEGCRCAAP